MKQMKFSGRETAVIRAIDFATGTTGAEIIVKTRIDPEEALDIVNGLMEVGYVETVPAQQHHVERDKFFFVKFEINPAYVHELKKAIARH